MKNLQKIHFLEICDLNDRESKIALLKKVNEIQENSDSQLNELRNKVNKQKEYFTKEIKSFKRTKFWS